MKANDVVKCVDDFGCDSITRGHQYRVDDVRTNGTGVVCIHINNGSGTNWYRADRFRWIGHTDLLEIGDEVRNVSDQYKCDNRYEVINVSRTGTRIQIVNKHAHCSAAMWENAMDYQRVTGIKEHLDITKITEAIVQNRRLEYWSQGRWLPLLNAGNWSVQSLLMQQVRLATDAIDYYGNSVPKPIKNYADADDHIWGVSFTKMTVYKTNKRHRVGEVHFHTEEEAERALAVIIAPFENPTEFKSNPIGVPEV